MSAAVAGPRLRAPTVDLHDAWLAAHDEWGPGLHEDGFGLRAEDEVRTPEGFARWVERLRAGPGRLWWIVEGAEVLGGIALRGADDERIARTGHLGYGVRPSARRRGVGTRALRLVLALAAEAGIDPVIAVCLAANTASVRTLERCGGVLLEQVEHGGQQVRRYALPAQSSGPGESTGSASSSSATEDTTSSGRNG